MTASFRAVGTVVGTTDKGNAFALLDDGIAVFIPVAIATKIEADVSDLLLLTCVLNQPKSEAIATTKWFCIHATRAEEALGPEDAAQVLSVLEGGDAWTAANMAGEIGANPEPTQAFLESNFRSGNGGKLMWFSQPNPEPDETYYALYPDRVTVANFNAPGD